MLVTEEARGSIALGPRPQTYLDNSVVVAENRAHRAPSARFRGQCHTHLAAATAAVGGRAGVVGHAHDDRERHARADERAGEVCELALATADRAEPVARFRWRRARDDARSEARVRALRSGRAIRTARAARRRERAGPLETTRHDTTRHAREIATLTRSPCALKSASSAAAPLLWTPPLGAAAAASSSAAPTGANSSSAAAAHASPRHGRRAKQRPSSSTAERVRHFAGSEGRSSSPFAPRCGGSVRRGGAGRLKNFCAWDRTSRRKGVPPIDDRSPPPRRNK